MIHRTIVSAALTGVIAWAGSAALADCGRADCRCPRAASAGEEKKVPAVLDFTMKTIDGKEQALGAYAGKVVMMVNTASKCGATPQYRKLQALYDKYKDRGLLILGFPANDFGKQEPGSDEDIKEFCEQNYGVTFPMFSKVVVRGEDKCALYKFLTSEETNPKFAGEIGWNFEKFLVGRDGAVVNRFKTRTQPDDESVIKAIEAALESKG